VPLDYELRTPPRACGPRSPCWSEHESPPPLAATDAPTLSPVSTMGGPPTGARLIEQLATADMSSPLSLQRCLLSASATERQTAIAMLQRKLHSVEAKQRIQLTSLPETDSAVLAKVGGWLEREHATVERQLERELSVSRAAAGSSAASGTIQERLPELELAELDTTRSRSETVSVQMSMEPAKVNVSMEPDTAKVQMSMQLSVEMSMEMSIDEPRRDVNGSGAPTSTEGACERAAVEGGGAPAACRA